MNDLVIQAKNLTKIYRLYAGPGYRFLDMFGMLGKRPGAYTEHAALDGVSLDIRRGEKVAFIGRNGAGKSTLLKLLTRVIEPTSGTLDVKGHAHALLQIGSGFHPDFTGRENVYAYLAQLGVTGAEADRKFSEIVEFAELEEYIGQPVKTYSSGMSVRPMFSTATAITPELLVLDEVLGVGDAYFAGKSFLRMREMCQGSGTTLLLVTHDIYSAVKMCDRIIWIDRGLILMDGDGPTVVKAYEDSIRQQEEHRLRLKKQQKLEELADVHAESARHRYAVVEIASRNGRPQQGLVHFAAIRLFARGVAVAELPLGESAFDPAAGSHLQETESAWGTSQERNGRLSRPMLNYGTPFHKVAGVFAVPDGLDVADDELECVVDYEAPEPCDLVVRLFMDGRELELGSIAGTQETWATWTGSATAGTPGRRSVSVNATGVQGTGHVVARDARFVDREGTEVVILKHGAAASLVIDYEVVDPDFDSVVQAVVVFHRSGVQDVCRLINRTLRFPQRKGSLRLDIDKMALTDGAYSITIMFVEEGYFDRVQTVFYSINPGVYCCLSRFFEVTVVDSGPFGSGTIVRADGRWSCQ